MQFKVPQNVQREDTIIGPITFKQLLILGIGGGITYAVYMLLATRYFIEIWLGPVLILGGLTVAFAFLKIHEMTFHQYLMSYIEFNFRAKKRIWSKGADTPFVASFQKASKKDTVKKEILKVKNQRNLNELTKILDSYGKSEMDEINKKEELEKIINVNYK